MFRSTRSPIVHGLPDDVPADDFGLGWVRDRVGTEELRQVVVLACAGSASGTEGAQGFASRFCAITERYGGRPEISGGETLYAVWGLVRSSWHDARLAGLAGLALLDEGEPRDAVRFAITADRIALPLGRAGDPDDPREGDVAEVIAQAAKMALLAAPRSVVATATAARLAGEAFELAPVSRIAARSGAELVRLVARKPEFLDDWLTATPQLVGRNGELAAIERAWLRVRGEGCGAALMIVGEAGIGKTTVVSAARRALVENGALSVRVSCTPEARARVAGPVSDLMSRLRFRAGDANSSAAAATDPLKFAAAIDEVGALARRRALALFVEDVHWADEATITFLAALAVRATEHGQILLIMTGRVVPDGLMSARAVVIDLKPLEADDVLTIIDGAGLGELPEVQRREIVVCAGGNPFLALELGRALPNAAMGPGKRVVKPGSLAEVLAMRLAGLGPLKALAQAAAVFADHTPTGVLAEMLSVDGRWLEPRLAALEAAGVLGEHTGRRGRWFRFTHVLLREAAYQSIAPRRLRKLHGLAASALASRAGADRFIEPAEIAAHFSAAGSAEDAFQWWRKAAERASGQASPAAAVAHLRQALVIAGGATKPAGRVGEIETLRQLGVALIQAKGSAGPEVRVTYERALALAETAPDVPGDLRFDLLWGLDAFLLAGGEVTDALSVGESLLKAAHRLGRQRVMLAHRMHAVAKLLAGSIGEAIELYRSALEQYEESEDPGLRFEWASDQSVVAHAHLCWALSIGGDDQGAARHARQALALAARIGHAHSSCHALGVLATAAQIRGERGVAAAYAVAGRAMAVHCDFPYWIAWCDIVAGWVAGGPAPEHGVRMIADAIAGYRATGARQALPYALMLLADAELRRGEPQRAVDAVEAARKAAASGVSLWDCELYRLEAMALRRLGATEAKVANCLRQGELIALRQGAFAFAARCRAERDGTKLAGK